MNAPPTIFVVDDDPAVSRALARVGELLGFPVRAFASGAEFLQGYDKAQPGCLVLDLKMPGMTGLELQQKLAEQHIGLPVIVISGHADVRIAVEVMSRGALTLLEKPFRLEELTTHIRRAVELDATLRATQARLATVETLVGKLTVKEREVLDLIAAGKTNKQIASVLRVSIRAVEDRRGRLMKKLGVRSIAELVQLYPGRDSSGSLPEPPIPGDVW
ncbi:MAG: response regulator transcription factor [Planctomycetales bacterium]|nr:response regulator transcription factor [Planctomycetales bacterium]